MTDKILFQAYNNFLNRYSIVSHENQLIQECSELILNLTKQRQRFLNGEPIEQSVLDNYPEELLHVRLIIDYLLLTYPYLQEKADKEFIILCKRRGLIK